MLPQVDSEDSDQPGRIPRLISAFAGCTGHFVGSVKHHLISHFMARKVKYQEVKLSNLAVVFPTYIKAMDFT